MTSPHPFDQVVETSRWFASREKGVNEVVFRSPASIGAFGSLTHMTFIRECVEDFFYREVRRGLRNALSDRVFVVNSLDTPHPTKISHAALRGTVRRPVNMIGDDGCLTFRSQWQELWPAGVELQNAKISTFYGVAANIDEAFETLLDQNPEYFIFGCFTKIATVVTNMLFDTRANLREISDDCDILIRCFHGLLKSYSYTIRDIMTNRIRGAARRLYEDRPNLGGMIASLKDHARQDTRDIGFEADFLDLDFAKDPLDIENDTFRLRWYRANYFWTYTFFEAVKFTDTVPPRPPTVEEVPHLALAQQSSKVKSDYAKCLGRFLALVLSFAYAPSVLDSPALRSITAKDRGEFPGRLLSGAHYIFVPVGVLIASMFFPEALFAQAKQYMQDLRPLAGDRQADIWLSILQDAFCKCARSLRSAEYHELVDILQDPSLSRHIPADFVSTLQMALASPDPKSMPDEYLTLVLELGWHLWQWRSTQPRQATKFGRIVGKITTDFWLSVMANSPVPLQKNSNDFICCFVVDQRAVYLSNFQPEGADKFTRTLFVDFALTGYQRARTAQRLCDISTHRSLLVRDIDRIRSMWEGMDEIFSELNTFDTESTPGSDDLFKTTDDVARCTTSISRLEQIQQQFDQMNSFLVFGITGRFLSAGDSMAHMRERITDIRQRRIPGFPLLGEFLERRVADSLRDITYLSQRYSYLRERLQDSYNRVRTELNSIQTSNIVEFSRSTMRFVKSAAETLEISRELQSLLSIRAQEHLSLSEQTRHIEKQLMENTRQLASSAARQERLGWLADLFALVAGTYYSYTMFGEIWDGMKTAPWYTRLSIVVLMTLVLGLLITLTRRNLMKPEPPAPVINLDEDNTG